MSNVLDLLVNVGIQDNGRISPALADEMRAERGYFREMLKRDLRNMYAREGVPIHSGELRQAIEAARVHWTDDEICRSLAVGWNRIEECMWGRDTVTKERTDVADCALYGGARVALKSLAAGVWMLAPRPQDSFEPEPDEPTLPTPRKHRSEGKREWDNMRITDLDELQYAIVTEIRQALLSLRPLTMAQVAHTVDLPVSRFHRPASLAKKGRETLAILRAWLTTPAGVEAVEAARVSTDPRKNRKSAVKEKVQEA